MATTEFSISSLPREILDLIIGLTFAGKWYNRHSGEPALVCKLWNSIARPYIFHSLTSPSGDTEGWEALPDLLSRDKMQLGRHVRYFEFSPCDDFPVQLLHTMPHLHTLKVHIDTGDPYPSFVGIRLSDSIKELSLRVTNGMRDRVWEEHDHGLHLEACNQFLAAVPGITSLKLDVDIRIVKWWGKKPLESVAPIKLPSLTSLAIEGQCPVKLCCLKHLFDLDTLQQITHLAIDNNYVPPPDDPESYLPLMGPQLQYLNLGEGFGAGTTSLEDILGVCPRLERLAVTSQYRGFSDRQAGVANSLVPRLHTLRIRKAGLVLYSRGVQASPLEADRLVKIFTHGRDLVRLHLPTAIMRILIDAPVQQELAEELEAAGIDFRVNGGPNPTPDRFDSSGNSELSSAV